VEITGLLYAGFALLLNRDDAWSTLLRTSQAGLTQAQFHQLKATVALQLTYVPATILSIGLAIAIAVARARGRLDRELAPLLVATPSEIPGAPEQCRRCGADLPHARSALRDCLYCRAANFVSAEGVVRALLSARVPAEHISPADAAKRLAQIRKRLLREWWSTLILGLAASPLLVGVCSYLLLVLVS
jgi:hypothetical protein